MRLKKLLPRFLADALDLRRAPVDAFVRREAAQVPSGARVVDLGCGECNYKPAFAHTRYLGIDLAVGNAGWDYSRISVLADLVRVPLRDGAADVVLCTETLEHLERPWRFAAEVSRILRPGGTLLLTTPQMARMHQVPYDFFRYTQFGLKSLFEREGLRAERIDPEGGYFIFLGDTFKHFHGHLFRSRWMRFLFFPFYWLSSVLCGLLVPVACRILDPLDDKRRFTMGYTCVFRKP
jgi:SAM-dependent methyltransferase